MSRRDFLRAGVGATVLGAMCPASGAQSPADRKILRYAFPIAETGFDPAQVIDLYSRTVAALLFDALYTYDHLAPHSTSGPTRPTECRKRRATFARGRCGSSKASGSRTTMPLAACRAN